MAILDYFRSKKKKTASLAKDRLQIIVAHQRSGYGHSSADYLPQLKEDILKVISKYVDIDPSQIKVQLDTNDDDCPILELNVALPEHGKLMK
ncbi:MAG: cell division topological specificity factor MinE [gamma proteobacterium symbiont of Lucinoma myriamae]|nr:cell division topological specificity factor MinE [gamma proteobacterium symbiont of Lucinoma myriamae]MCU7818495.1 cell division topological specificity factor MinE [gamma proteobacterium symbiont of Lucinoma myriamae]MCU7832213.1 cell division topological specificity factor MinE [gamma proteobacterium symbiont of Lucinoma myriamae]